MVDRAFYSPLERDSRDITQRLELISSGGRAGERGYAEPHLSAYLVLTTFLIKCRVRSTRPFCPPDSSRGAGRVRNGPSCRQPRLEPHTHLCGVGSGGELWLR